MITCTGSTDPVEHFKANLLALREQLVKAKKEVEKVTKERDEVRDLLAAPVLTVYMCVICDRHTPAAATLSASDLLCRH